MAAGKAASASIKAEKAGLLETLGEYGEAIQNLTTAVETYETLIADTAGHEWIDDCAVTLNALSWLRSTCVEAQFRDGWASVELARRACELKQWKEYPYFDTLAAAYAEAGNFENAVLWQRKAYDLAADNERADYQQRLALYQQRKPYRSQVRAEAT